jgi:hypothetical protein
MTTLFSQAATVLSAAVIAVTLNHAPAAKAADGVPLVNAPADAGTHRARRFYCVGGPRGPAYAYTRSWDAEACARRVGSFSNACARAVRQGSCRVWSRYDVDTVDPGYCECAPQYGRYVGTW